MIRMLVIGYCFGIRSERRLCEEVHVNLAYRLVLPAGARGQDPGSFDVLEESPRTLPP
jgi:transposase